MQTLSALLESTRRRREANLRELVNALVHLDATGDAGTLIGEVMASREEVATLLNFARRFATSSYARRLQPRRLGGTHLARCPRTGDRS
jgi:hypothetical protein